MPLETYTGHAVDALLVRARQNLGPEAEIIAVRTIRTPVGGTVYQVLATDPASAAEERRRTAPDGGSHPLLKSSPNPEDFAKHPRGQHGPRLLAFVGPTGVGKTTTIAKLATHPEFFRRKQVGFLCLDTYRVGAVEQLRTYAEIAGLPLEVIYESSDIPGVLERLSRCDVIFVDTPGRSPRLHADTAQVRQWLTYLLPSEVHLVLPAGVQPELVRRTVEAHRAFGITHILATKLDEAPDDWTIPDAAAEARIPMRWVTDGQEVPRDIKTAAPRLLASIAALRVRTAVPAEVMA